MSIKPTLIVKHIDWSHNQHTTKTSQRACSFQPTRTEKHENLTKPIRNAGFVVIRRFKALNKVRQIIDLAFKMNKLKTKYNVLAQCKTESSMLSTALLAIHKPLKITYATLIKINQNLTTKTNLPQGH